MIEIFRSIAGYEGLYEISNLNNVRSLKNGKMRVLKPTADRNGYLRIQLWKDGKGKTFLVHRLVYEAFRGTIPEGMQVNHINEVKTDCRLENLNLMTCKANINWGTGIARRAEKRRNDPNQSKPLYQIIPETGEIVREWPSTRECSRNGFNQGSVSACCRNCYMREGNNVYKGYIWQYK